MPKNFWWLFASYSVIWLALFFYVMRLLVQARELGKDLQRLRSTLGESE